MSYRKPAGWQAPPAIARPIAEYHEDMGPVLWWTFPIEEPPYVGTPNDVGYTVQVNFDVVLRSHVDTQGENHEFVASRNVGGWPGYHTHFTPIPMAVAPVQQ